jgi:hypothetical protein
MKALVFGAGGQGDHYLDALLRREGMTCRVLLWNTRA